MSAYPPHSLAGLNAVTPADRHSDTHPRIVRVTHWINAIAMIIMIGSGWRIYNDSPLIEGFHFPAWISLGGDPDVSFARYQNSAFGALQWHFAAMWVLVLNGALYLAYGLATGHFRRKLLPLAPVQAVRDALAALRGRLSHDDLSVYNAAQRAAYLGAIVLVVGVVLSGLAIWKPVQLYWLAALMGDFEGARILHFFCMAGIVLFVLVHVAMVLLVPKTFLTMITGKAKGVPSHG